MSMDDHDYSLGELARARMREMYARAALRRRAEAGAPRTTAATMARALRGVCHAFVVRWNLIARSCSRSTAGALTRWRVG
jgi:hypothetical protein